MDKTSTIHLLILVESSHDAEVLASSLRNSGFAVRPQHVEDEEDLVNAMENSGWDMLISAPAVGDYTANHAINHINNSGKDIPCIVFGDAPDNASILDARRNGAVDYIASANQDLLLLVLEREIGHLQERRSHRECRSSLIESEKRNRMLLDSSRDAISYIHEGMHIYANDVYLDLFGYNSDDVESIPIMDLIALDAQQAFKDVLRTLSKGETPDQEFQFEAVCSDESQFKATMTFSPASIEGEPCTQIIIHQQTDNAHLEKELNKLKQQDLLTGLYNRQHFMEELNSAVTAAAKSDTSHLLYIEPDNFNGIKEIVGISGSDIALTDIAGLLNRLTPNEAILARFSETVFTIIIPDKATASAENLAEKIRKTFENHIFEVEDKTVSTTCSIGVTAIVETTPDAKKAFAHADAACSIAKGEKGNAVHVHTLADEIATLEEERAWVERVRLALKENRFVLHYQPIVSLHAEPGERYEVLLRMIDEEDNLVMPNEFMEAAQNGGLMIEIDRWVMKNSAKALLEKKRTGAELRFFIKLSDESISDASLLPWISKLLKAARLHGSSMVFEISENTAINNLKTIKVLINGLKQLHCLFAIDHVGEDNENINYLNHIEVHYLRIGRSHIENITQSETSQEFVKGIADHARKKNILTIAGHVQDPACLAVLWQHGVNFIQGYYLQQPEGAMDYDFTSENE